MPVLGLGDTFPNIECDTTEGKTKFYDWQGAKWAIFFSHPRDYTPVCTTELGKAAKLAPEFEKRNMKMIALSCDSLADHKGWIEDIKSFKEQQGFPMKSQFPFPMIADPERKIASQLGLADEDEKDSVGVPFTCRAVYIVSPDHKVKTVILYPATSGRDFDEILRVVDSIQLVQNKNNEIATPQGWRPGDKVMVAPIIPEDQIKAKFPQGVEYYKVPSGKNYLRLTEIDKNAANNLNAAASGDRK